MSKCQSVKMKMRWVTKFNLGVKQVPGRGKGTGLRARTDQVKARGTSLRTDTVRSQQERDRPSADGREAERRGGRKRNGCCLSEASFIHFPTAAKRSSPDGAALTFWFFWVKPKERNIPIGCQAKRTESSSQKSETTVKMSKCQSVKIKKGGPTLHKERVPSDQKIKV